VYLCSTHFSLIFALIYDLKFQSLASYSRHPCTCKKSMSEVSWFKCWRGKNGLMDMTNVVIGMFLANMVSNQSHLTPSGDDSHGWLGAWLMWHAVLLLLLLLRAFIWCKFARATNALVIHITGLHRPRRMASQACALFVHQSCSKESSLQHNV